MRKPVIGAAIGLTAALVALAVGALPFVQIVELKTYDWRMRATTWPGAAPAAIVLVTIDEESLRGLEPLVGRWPWPRLVHAQLLNYLARAKPRAVVYDVLFTESDRRKFFVQDEEWTGAESDAELAAAARKLPVIFPGDAVPEALDGGAPPQPLPATLPLLDVAAAADIAARPVFVPPISAIAASARVVAHNFAALDTDGPWRRYVPFIRYQDKVIPSLAVAAAAVVTGTVPTPSTGRTLIPFRGRRPDGRSPYSRVSFYSLFYAEQQMLEGQQPAVDPGRFRDAIVLVGATAPALDDVFTVPLSGKMSGIDVHADVIDSLLAHRRLSPVAHASAVALTMGAAVLLGVLGSLAGPWITIAMALGFSAAVTTFTTREFAAGRWHPLVVPLLALTLVTFGSIAYEYFVEGREKRRIKHLFSHFVSRDVYQQLMKDPAGARLGGQRRRMTVLFSDIRGFTSVAERGQPEAIVAQLNEYFSRMVPIVLAHHGTVDKFVGDMIMALYGAPLDDDDHADHAVQTALAMSEALSQLNRAWRAAGRPTLDIGIGINTGEMVAGNLGSNEIMSYTVIGDEVNLGSRLESLSKEFHTRIIISEATRAALKGRYDIGALGEVVVKGKSRPVSIFSVVPSRAVVDGLTADAVATDTSPGTVIVPPGQQESDA